MSAELPPSAVDLAREADFQLEGLAVRPSRRELVAGAERSILEPRVMQVLVALARRAGDVVSRDELIASCWNGRIVGDDAINACVAKVRRVGERSAAYRIETIPRVGYRLAPAQAPEDAPVPGPSGKPSIAVLPFANLSDEPGQDYFVDGMVEEISTALTRFRSLFVVAGGSGLSLKGQGLMPQEAGRRLGVRYLLDGAVRRAADRVRISVSLIDARDGVQLWADRFDGDMTDIFSLQDEVALSAAARIEPRVQAEETRRAQAKPASDLDAYDLFLRGRALVRSSGSREAFQEAQPLFERCLALAPYDARALVSCADVLGVLVAFGCADEDRLRALARERVQAALRLAPDDAEVLAGAAVALLDLQEDIPAARSLADRAIAVNPGNALGWRASGCLRAFTDPDIAAEHLEHSLRLDPLSPHQAPTLTALGFARIGQRRIEDAIALFRQSAHLLPGYPTNYVMLAVCHAHLGQLAEARDAAARFRATAGRSVREHADRLGASDWIKSRLARVEPDA
jgi:TolB-like protein/Tfp pilus assembly protein PilF